MGRGTRFILAGLLALLAAAPVAQAAPPYASGRFDVRTNGFTFGQAPAWMPDGRVVFHDDRGDGQQVYTSALDGNGERCVTCGKQPGPNMVATARPQGDWLMFHSWKGHQITIGAPGFGGIGSNVYVSREDGSGLTALTTDPEGEDNFHAYFSPDGRQVVWTHINWNAPEDNGRGLWDVRLADFVVGSDGVPRLENERVVRPDNGHFYETQWWAPDGSGFLYTESTGTSGNLELYFFRLRGKGPQVVHLSDDNPAWDEQAIFTPDGKNVIFMSTRDHPGNYNAYAQLAQAMGLPAEADYLLILPLFEAGFLQPILPEANDLYEINLRSGGIRRLTHDGDEGWISPEFSFDRRGRLLWTELKIMDGVRQSAPVDPGQRVQQEIDLITHPPDPQLDKTGHGGGQGFEIVKRTRIGEFVR